MSQLFESEIYARIGGREFAIPRGIFSGMGNSQNFFSLGFTLWWKDPKKIFPGVDRSSLLRPPVIAPPAVPNRSGDIFEDIISLLRGYPLHFRDDEHRASVLRDCRYYHLRGLEQRVIPHEIYEDPLRGGQSEIVIHLEDVRQSGIQFAADNSDSNATMGREGWVLYSRPFVDEVSRDLIVQIGGDATSIDLATMRAEFCAPSTKARMFKLFQVVGDKMGLQSSLSAGDRVPIRLDDAYIVVNGVERDSPGNSDRSNGQDGSWLKRRRIDTDDDISSFYEPVTAQTLAQPPRNGAKWIVRTGQWRLRIQANESGSGGVEMVLIALKLDVYTTQQWRNRTRNFLTSVDAPS